MTAAVVCDGCTGVITGPAEQVGHVHKHDYCKECAPMAKQMLIEFDELHDHLAYVWESGATEIKEKYRSKLENIPDEQPI